MLVEDDERLSGLVQRFLDKHGFRVLVENRGDRAVDRILKVKPDAVILDIMLPGVDGLEVCRALQGRFDGAILMLTARGEELDELEGFERGADDYMIKPVRPQVLLARLRSLLRRVGRHAGGTEPERVVVGAIELDSARRVVTHAGRELELTGAEFDLLWFLARRAGQVVSRETIYRDLRGIEYDGIDRSIDLRVSKLRKKLEDDPRAPRIIKSVRGVGYIFAGEAS